MSHRAGKGKLLVVFRFRFELCLLTPKHAQIILFVLVVKTSSTGGSVKHILQVWGMKKEGFH